MRLSFALALVISALGSLGCDEGSFTPGPCGLPWPPQADGYCGDATPGLIDAAGDPATPAEPLTEQPIEGSACNAVERSFPLESATHLTPCSPVEHGTNPPSSGMHYGNFPQFRVYEHAIPRGFVVHGLEHGGVAISYSCAAVEDDVAAARELAATLEVAPQCCSAAGCPPEA